MPAKLTAAVVIVIVLVLSCLAVYEAYGQDNTQTYHYQYNGRVLNVDNVTSFVRLYHAGNVTIDLVTFSHLEYPTLIVSSPHMFQLWNITSHGLEYADL